MQVRPQKIFDRLSPPLPHRVHKHYSIALWRHFILLRCQTRFQFRNRYLLSLVVHALLLVSYSHCRSVHVRPGPDRRAWPAVVHSRQRRGSRGVHSGRRRRVQADDFEVCPCGLRGRGAGPGRVEPEGDARRHRSRLRSGPSRGEIALFLQFEVM